MPSMRAPICISRRARSWTCGSEAALWITVAPGVSAAAISAFSVAMTEASSMKKSQACSPSGASSTKERVGAHLGARARGRRPGAGRAGGGRSRRRRAAASRPGRSAPAAGRRAGRRRGCARRASASTCVCEISSHAERDRRSRRATRRSRRGARAARPSPPTSRMRGTLRSTTSSAVSRVAASAGSAAFLLPAGTIVPERGAPPSMMNFSMRGPSGAGMPAAKGIEGHRRRFGPGSNTLPPAPSREEAWALFEEWIESRVAAQAPARRRGGDARLRAQVGRGRGAVRASPACCTTSTTSATRTSTPATRARRWSCSRSAATRRS